jgi:hypothetical protein
MTATEALRKQVKKYVDKADEKSLRMVHAIFEIEEGYDLWDELPENVKEDVDEALVESAKKEGRPHKEVMKKYKKWRTK